MEKVADLKGIFEIKLPFDAVGTAKANIIMHDLKFRY